MLRRSILQISYSRGLGRIPRPINTQHTSRFLRREFSAAAEQPGDASKSPPPPPPPAENGGSSVKVFVGSALVGAGFVAGYKTGYLDLIFGGKEKIDSVKEAGIGGFENKDEKAAAGDLVEEKVEVNSDDVVVVVPPNVVEGLSRREGEEEENRPLSVLHDKKSETSDITTENTENGNPRISSEGDNVDVKSSEEVQTSPSPVVSEISADHREENEAKTLPPQQQEIIQEKAEVSSGNEEELLGSLLKTYHLRDEADESIETNSNAQGGNEKEALVDAIDGLDDAYVTKDGKLVLDFLQAIHTAEKRQAELDAHVFSEEKRALKEKYEKKLKDAGARELMLAEEAAMLDKELKRERAKAVAALKSLQEKLEEKFKTELEQKESEAEMKLKKVEELAKAELAAAIASEKTSQLEKMAEANLHINALCVAFYARSEEARQTHSAHKLALGALALEDALSKGLPIQTEIEALHTYLDGIDKDSILDLVLSSLPEETRRTGTDTLLQLNQKFDVLKGTVRHLSLIPHGGGGILAHSLAHVASWLKVKEVDQSGDGIESIINKVENYLAEGKIAEAAEALEGGVKGTQAMEVVGHWVKCARNRAITDQALTLLQSYATSISVT